MAKAKPVDQLNYEQAFEELESIVEQLQTAGLPLDEALSLFERGQALSTRCNELLELTPDETQGCLETDFSEDADD